LPYTYTLLDIHDVTMWQVAVMQGMISMLLVIVAVNVGILIYALRAHSDRPGRDRDSRRARRQPIPHRRTVVRRSALALGRCG